MGFLITNFISCTTQVPRKYEMKNQTKSPLKDSPLRSPGQSLDESIQKMLDEEISTDVLFPLLLLMFTVWNWFLLKPKQTGKELGNGYKPHEQWTV